MPNNTVREKILDVLERHSMSSFVEESLDDLEAQEAILKIIEDAIPKKSTPMGGEYHDGYSAGWNSCLSQMRQNLMGEK